MAMAPQPDPPVRSFSFTDWQVAHPDEPPPGDHLDGEIDNTNNTVAETLSWAAVSLNTDGTLRDGIVDQSNMVSGLFDDIAQGIIDDVQPLVNQAASSAAQSFASATAASASRDGAAASAVLAQGAAAAADVARSLAALSQAAAQQSASTAGDGAATASNEANHATEEANRSYLWGLVSQAWAEHMPDPIPPNILAVMGITGDHWSSRWWANKAAGSFGALVAFYAGAWPSPPTTMADGSALVIGAIYYNTTTKQPYVWDGSQWLPFYEPAAGVTFELVYSATAGQTVFDLATPDLAGGTYVLNAAQPEPLDIHVNGLLVPPAVQGGTWTVDYAANEVTFAPALALDDVVQISVLASPTSLQPTRVGTQRLLDLNVDPVTGTPGQVDGTRTVFQLSLASGSPPHVAAMVSTALEVFISVDGVPQQPYVDYTVALGFVTFVEPPQPGAICWALYYGPTVVVGDPLPPTLPGSYTILGDLNIDGDLNVRDIYGHPIDGLFLHGVVHVVDQMVVDNLVDSTGHPYLSSFEAKVITVPTLTLAAATDATDKEMIYAYTSRAVQILRFTVDSATADNNYNLELFNGDPDAGGVQVYLATMITRDPYVDTVPLFIDPTDGLWLRVTNVDDVATTLNATVTLTEFELVPA